MFYIFSSCLHAIVCLLFIFSFAYLQSECQQLICDILRATPDATSADAAVQTARLASKTDPNAAKYAKLNTFVSGARKGLEIYCV